MKREGLADRRPVGALQACENEGRLISGGWRIKTKTFMGSSFPLCFRAYPHIGSVSRLYRIWCTYSISGSDNLLWSNLTYSVKKLLIEFLLCAQIYQYIIMNRMSTLSKTNHELIIIESNV